MKLLQGDCLELMKDIPTKSVDMVLADPPYGITSCNWDSIIPLAPMWENINRVIKDNGAILLFSAQPFTSALITSNLKMFKYEWIWQKTSPRGHLNAKKMPMRVHENIEVFYKKPPLYIPQMTSGHKRRVSKSCYVRKAEGYGCYGEETRDTVYDSTDRYPIDIQKFNNSVQKGKLHPTQKPLDLLCYLIKTYTNEGDTVLDFAMGSGSTGVACTNINRDFIGMELDAKYFNIAKNRIKRNKIN